jgi:hypothetical protein
MDSQTHVEFADKLLAIAGKPAACAVASLFPQIDRHPHVFHRMYAHTVLKARRLTRTGLQILTRPDWRDDAHTYEVRRFREEQTRFENYMRVQRWQLPALDARIDDAALLAFVSHLYLDTFNQPTQPFAPLSVYCSGQWQLWEKIGDFRLTLYTTPVIARLRRELMAHALWAQADAFAPDVQIEAMLLRLCELSLGRIGDDIVEPAMQAMQLTATRSPAVNRCCDFLAQFERVLVDLHIRHLEAADSDPVGSQVEALEAVAG